MGIKQNISNSSFIDEADDVIYEIFLKWLNEETIKKISYDLKEPEWMLEHRLYSFKIFKEINKPGFWPDISSIDFDSLVYYAKPKKWFVWATDSWDNVPQNIKNVFQRLNIPEADPPGYWSAGVCWSGCWPADEQCRPACLCPGCSFPSGDSESPPSPGCHRSWRS